MKTYRIAIPSLDALEEEAVIRVLRSGWITQGPEVKQFEKEFCQFTGAPHALAVSNCTTALHLALRGLGVGPGDVVLTVSCSFIATANAIRHCGAEPYFVDVSPDLNMNPDHLQEILETQFDSGPEGYVLKNVEWIRNNTWWSKLDPSACGRLKAVLVVHQIGRPAQMSKLIPICQKYRVPIVEDAACAIGSQILWNDRWTEIGFPIGEAVCFSFHPRKILTTGDGGMITSKERIDHQARLERQHAMSLTDLDRHNSQEIQFEEYVGVGFNYRMTDLQAAIGRVQLSKVSEIINQRRELVAIYQKYLSQVSELTLDREPSWAKWNYQSFPIYINDSNKQKQFMASLKSRGVDTRRGIMCSHLEPAFRFWKEAPGLDTGRDLRDRGIILPLHSSLNEEDIFRIVEAVKVAVRETRS